EDRQSGRCFLLGVPTELHKFWISQNLLERICSEISALYQNPFQIELVVTGQGSVTLADNHKLPQELPGLEVETGVVASSFGSQRDMLNTDYTFSTFVVGRNNEFAHAASFSIAENPGKENYNPLFICGPTGMGKTHLLNAVGNHIRTGFPHLRILYVSAERFLNE